MKQLTSSLLLTLAELTFLLTLVHAETLPGSSNVRTAPARKGKPRDMLWKMGRSALLREGWMVERKTNQFDLNPQLLQMVAGIAEARTVLISEWHGLVPRQGVTHYITESFVVEQAFENGVYKFVLLPDSAVMTARLANQFGFPATDSADLTFTLSKKTATKAKKNPDPDDLIAAGLQPETATLFTETLGRVNYQGTVRVMQTALGQVKQVRVLGFVASDNCAWLVGQMMGEQVRYVSADIPTFQRQIHRLMRDVHLSQAT